jgi:hypothetical protein
VSLPPSNFSFVLRAVPRLFTDWLLWVFMGFLRLTPTPVSVKSGQPHLWGLGFGLSVVTLALAC